MKNENKQKTTITISAMIQLHAGKSFHQDFSNNAAPYPLKTSTFGMFNSATMAATFNK